MALSEELSGKKDADAANTNDAADVTNPDLYKITCHSKHGISEITISCPTPNTTQNQFK